MKASFQIIRRKILALLKCKTHFKQHWHRRCDHANKCRKHVLDLRLNLIFVGKLDDVGLVSHFGAKKWKLTKGSMVIAKGLKEGSLYIF